MFDRLWKPKFYCKCKSHIKLTKKRLDAIRTKRKVVVRNSRNDIANLMRNGHDYHIYDMAYRLLTDQNELSCYDMIYNFCDIIMENLSLMCKKTECPSGCKESVASLIYAAERLGALPELCHLRDLFTETYQCSLQSFTNKEMIHLTPDAYKLTRKFQLEEKFQSELHPKGTVLQLMQEIEKEGSIEWSSNFLEQNQQPSPPPKTPDPNNVRLETSTSQYQVKSDQNESNFVADCSKWSTDENLRTSFLERVDVRECYHQVSPLSPLLNQNRRGASLPMEESRRSESMKKNVRMKSLPQETPRYVHPRLPEWDKLTAQFQLLTGRRNRSDI